MAQYQPLDLSFLQNYGSAQRDSTSNLASMLLANSGWSSPANATLAQIAQSNAAASPHRVSGISRLMDLLSVPTYGIADALDKAIQGHQSSNNDSVSSDIGSSLLGAAQGAGKGVLAGLRGAFGSDAAAANPADKTRFNDVINRLYTHMSTADATNPANMEKVRQELSKAKVNQLGGTDKNNLLYPNGVSDQDIKNFFKTSGYAGIASDIVSDPLNLVNPASGLSKIKDLVTGGKKTAEIPQGLRGVNDASKFANVDRATGIPSKGYVNSLASNFKPGEFKLPPPRAVPGAVPGAVPNVAPELAAAPQLPANVDRLGSMLRNNHVVEFPNKGSKFYSNIRNKINNPAGVEVSITAQKALAGKILAHVQSNDPRWVYKAVDELRTTGKEFPQTQAFLENVSNVAKSRNIPAKQFMKQLAVDLPRRINADVSGMRAIAARDLVNHGPTADVILKSMVQAPKRLKATQADIAFNTIRKYQSRVLGKVAPTVERIPGAQNLAISSGRNARYSGPQQVNMYQTILHNLKYSSPRKFDHATDILSSVENYFKSKGAMPFSAVKIDGGHNLDLSRVLRAIGPQAAVMNRSLLTKILAGDPEALASLSSETVQRIEALKAGESMAAATGVKAGIDHGKEIGDLVAKAPLAPARKIPLAENVIRNTKLAAHAAGGGDAGAFVAGRYIADHFNLAGPVNMVYKTGKLDTAAIMAEAAKTDAHFTRIDPKQIIRLNRSLAQAAESPPVRDLGKLMEPFARTADWFGARFNAAYGNADFRPVFLKHQASAYSTSALRSRYINKLRRQYGASPELWSDAMKSAQKNAPPSGIEGDQVDALSKEIQKTMESLFGGSGIREGAMAEATVAARTRLTMKELNTNMKKFGLGGFKFTSAKLVKDASGMKQNYSKGIDWLKSWESWTIQDPYKFLHQIQAAVEYSAREKMIFDEIASRFGSFNKLDSVTNPVKYGINHPRLKNVYFTAEGARQGETFLKILKEVNAPSSKALQHVQHVTSKFKAAVTVYWPVHHVNNMIGDTVMNWYAGVGTIAPYSAALKVMRSQRGAYADVQELGMLTSPNALRDAVQAMQSAGKNPIATGNKIAFTMRNGERVSNDMVATAARKMGILPSGRILEDVHSDVSGVLDKIGLPGKYHGVAQHKLHALSETRDHYPRYAQFIDHLMKAHLPFEQAIHDAGAAVRKWHPDGLDLTHFERNTIKTVLPFYSWMRKAIPLAIETALTSPGKVKAYPQLMEAIQIYNGVTPEDNISQPFPTDQLFPDWMREKGIGPISGVAGSYSVFNPSIPANDVFSSIFTPKPTIEGYLNPLIKTPFEMLQGREMTTGQGIGGINNQSYMDYLLKQTPIVSNVGRLSGQFAVSNAQQTSGGPNWQNILNTLTGLRKTNTGPYQKSAQFNLRDYLKSQYK